MSLPEFLWFLFGVVLFGFIGSGFYIRGFEKGIDAMTDREEWSEE